MTNPEAGNVVIAGPSLEDAGKAAEQGEKVRVLSLSLQLCMCVCVCVLCV